MRRSPIGIGPVRLVKVLVTTTPGVGHVLPLLPLAQELRSRGHDVRWVAGPGGCDAVSDSGFEVTEAGMPVGERQAEFARRYPHVSSLPGRERQLHAFGKVFGELAVAPMVEVVRNVVDTWQPDVVVHDAAELAAPLAAAAAGIPTVCHGFGEVLPEAAVRRAGEQMAPLWEARGLAPDAYAGSYRGLYVDIYPPSLRSMDQAHVPRVQPRRPAVGERASGNLVYVTFGTEFNQLNEGFRAAVLAAAAVADEVLVTIGAGSPTDLGPMPANVSVERFVPQAQVLPRCSAVVCHGGSGTVLASLAHGVPVMCLPRGADQFANAVNVARVGAGAMLLEPEVTERALQVEMDRLVRSAAPRAAAIALSEEIAAMPSDAEVALAVEAHAGSL